MPSVNSDSCRTANIFKEEVTKCKNTEKDDGIFCLNFDTCISMIMWNKRGDAEYLPLFPDCKSTFDVLIIEDTKQMRYLGKP